MITPIQAYKKVCNFLGEKVTVKICRDYEDYYSFYVTAPNTPVGAKAFVGGVHYIVSKKTGKVYASDDEKAPKLPFGFWEGVDPRVFFHG